MTASTRSRGGSALTYPPAILGAIGALFILIVLLHYSTVISRLSDQNTILAQRLALLEQQQREGDNQGTVTSTGGLTT